MSWDDKSIENCLKNHDLDLLKSLIEQPGFLDWKIWGRKAIHLAARHGFIQGLEALLDAGASIDDLNGIYYTPLMEALGEKKVETARFLISRGANINYRIESEEKNSLTSQDGDSALLIAALTCPECCKDLLDRGADMNARRSFSGWSPLLIVASNGNLELLKVFFDYGADANESHPNGKKVFDLIPEKIKHDLINSSQKSPHEQWAFDFMEKLKSDEKEPKNNNLKFELNHVYNTFGMDFIKIGQGETDKKPGTPTLYLQSKPITWKEWKSVMFDVTPEFAGDMEALCKQRDSDGMSDFFLKAINSREKHLNVNYRIPSIAELMFPYVGFVEGKGIEAFRDSEEYLSLKKWCYIVEDGEAWAFNHPYRGKKAYPKYEQMLTPESEPVELPRLRITGFMDVAGKVWEQATEKISQFANVTDGYVDQTGVFYCNGDEQTPKEVFQKGIPILRGLVGGEPSQAKGFRLCLEVFEQKLVSSRVTAQENNCFSKPIMLIVK